MNLIRLYIFAALAGCAIVGNDRVEGWPDLRIVEHRVPEAVMRDRCVQYVGAGMSPMACAEFDFAAKRCDIWLSADFPPPSSMVEHEKLHCMGYDHVGGSQMRRLLERG